LNDSVPVAADDDPAVDIAAGGLGCCAHCCVFVGCADERAVAATDGNSTLGLNDESVQYVVGPYVARSRGSSYHLACLAVVCVVVAAVAAELIGGLSAGGSQGFGAGLLTQLRY